MRYFKILLLIFIPIASLFSQSYKGDIRGTIIDGKTKEPLPGVNVVVIEKPTIGTTTDFQGKFILQGLEVGTISLRMSVIGYASKIITNVVVSTGRATPVFVEMEEKAVETNEITVSTSYYSRAQTFSPLSANTYDRSEILRAPGSIQDVQRVVQNLPGVASSNDNVNELIVRGGAPYENLTIMDHMEVPSINHYANDYNSAGPINMLNADMIRDVQFSAGGFPAQYGDKVSSVMNISVREGDRHKLFSSNSGFNMAGLGTLIEGGFAGERGSYIFSYRKSLLEIVDKLFGMSKLSLTAVPKYWDAQAKVVYDLSESQKLSFNYLYGHSTIDIKGDPKEKDNQRKNIIDSASVETIIPTDDQYVVGLNLTSLWGKTGYSVLTLYSAGSKYDEDVSNDFTRQVRDQNGDVTQYQTLNSYPEFYNYSTESFAAAKYEVFLQPHPRHELSLGTQILTTLLWKNDEWMTADTSRIDISHSGMNNPIMIIQPEGRVNHELKFGDASKYYFYASDKINVMDNIFVTLGGRYDHFTYSGKGNFSPRANISYQIIPMVTTLSFAIGRYYQAHPFPTYGDRYDSGINRNLENMCADHYVVGFEHLFGEGSKLSMEAYYKKYSKIAVSEQFIYSAIDTFLSEKQLTVGQRRSYGVEFFLEQKQVKDFYGTIALSLSQTKDADPRIPKQTDWYRSEFDYPIILTVIGGRIVRGFRDILDDAPFFVKYPTYILPFSNEMELSLKFQYQSGRLYTPMEFVTWRQDRIGNTTWSNGYWESSNDVFSERYPDYSRVDLQWISRYYFNSWNINIYLAVQNLLNRKNIFYVEYRSDGTTQTVYQFAFFPVGGVEIEF